MARMMMMLTSMAGEAFSHAHGDLVHLEDEIAEAWKKAGIVGEAPEGKVSAEQIARLEAQLSDAMRIRDTAAQQVADAKGLVATAVADRNGAMKERDIHRKNAEEATTRAASLEQQLAAARDEISRITAERDGFADQAKALGDQLTAALAAKPADAAPAQG